MNDAATPKRKLIEVALPLEAINRASVREKSIRHGHPSTLHLWWSRKPLATCRAVLFAQLVDDPSSHPERFPTEAAVKTERERLFGLMEELVQWKNSTNETVLKQARAEIKKSCGEELPPIYDPFSGGGSIPLEAQRLGLPAYGSDLNPVAVMIGKAMIEIPPKFKDQEPVHPGAKGRTHYRNAEGLAEDVKYYGEWILKRAQERIGHLYPQVELPRKHGGGKATVIAWLWARTVPSPDPAFADVQVPIASSFLLNAKKGKQEAWIEPIVDRQAKTISYRIRYGGTKEEINAAKRGTSAGARQGFRCILSGAAIPLNYIKRSGKQNKMGQQLIAIVAKGTQSRVYIEPLEEHEKLALSAKPKWKPESTLSKNTRSFTTPNYGLTTFGDIFTNRQLVALTTFNDLVKAAQMQIETDALVAGMLTDPNPLRDGGTGAKAYAQAVSVYLVLAMSKLADYSSSIASWHSSGEKMRNTFTRQAITMIWDYAEVNPFSESSGNWMAMNNWIYKVIVNFIPLTNGWELQDNAENVVYPSNVIISTDPPYYDNIGYADLSDFFYCWMRPVLRPTFPDIFSILETPKSDELIADPYRHGSKKASENFFLSGMSRAIIKMAHSSSDAAPTTIYYAFKQHEIQVEGISSTGWATFLQAVLNAGFVIVRTWPMRTELSNRPRGIGSNALANSVVLVCRKRKDSADVVTRAEFLRALKRELPPAIAQLQAANIAPTDMPQSAIGPGMAVFSRYRKVLEANDNPMTVKTALQLINAQLDEFNDLQMDGVDDETRFAVTWFQQYGHGKGAYGIADNMARARGISVERIQQAGIVESGAGHVHILQRSALDPQWSPATDKQLTIWECCQHLIRVLENDGETGAAQLRKAIGSEKADMVKDLAYHCYDICANKRKDAKEAMAYNSLIAVWSDLTDQAAKLRDDNTQQMELTQA